MKFPRENTQKWRILRVLANAGEEVQGNDLMQEVKASRQALRVQELQAMGWNITTRVKGWKVNKLGIRIKLFNSYELSPEHAQAFRSKIAEPFFARFSKLFS